ncbi:MAG: hypothetical protein HY941_06270 [Gammaproteobacteria bacterium]|nr:hypothetical protein [Gammaproteobacteria bacterium]
MKPVYRNRKPDPLVLLALLVGLGVVVTTNLPTALRAAAEMLSSYSPGISSGFGANTHR